ncbi:MAG: helix-turn-helix domain-containing protein [Candidatus Aminicenantes bacterium]|nr:helix-turn-helix domain-containing protein [Candidatus Aminicenantes bacterium]NIM79250.1 helix-turn-helix domain-containing protein [Candidatus Aminicenantes bacterium]NIN18536.1 helix-turn-helix domain-containing protein [Candidatus Aminicenantes bacterium]NIN42432.1 helix-turn-helix domain-containing protein [Candidatus Aminicenantes bacterium]NIN85191.1 helix-turn-helix domain-containing protein [Candidatus Aminicenantes bacterium]
MKKTRRKESSKIKHDSALKKEIGRRFKRFRHKIKKSQKQLADELQLYQSTITNIEVGKTFPATAYLRYFYDKYQLNADWLINGNGDMLHSDLEELKTAFHLLFGLDKQYFHQYLELIHLMKVPIIREVIFGKLVEMTKIAKDEIEEFRRTVGSRH